MIVRRKQRYLFSVLILFLLVVATGAAYWLSQSIQDLRQQASVNPYLTTTASPTPDSKGIVTSPSNNASRPTTQTACSGVWMNNFCYLPGDELAGGYIVVASVRYNFPYIEKKVVYDSPTFNTEMVKRNLGGTKYSWS